MSPRVAVIDVGSNSIKALVAERAAGPFGLRPVFEKTLEVRISQGIGGPQPVLRADRIEAGAEAVRELCERCQQHGPLARLRIVATSAVRSAANGHIFIAAVRAMTGQAPDILTGSEEAEAIAMGVRTDPRIEMDLTDFTVFDLGGGSLELIRFEHHGITDRTSLPLGAVRLTEQFISDPSRPVPLHEAQGLARHVRAHVEATGMILTAPLVGCSGGLAALRHIAEKRHGQPASAVSGRISRHSINELARDVLAMDLPKRMTIPGMPERRADIFPAALLVFQILMDLARAEAILHSYHNLRYGLALRMLHADAS